MYMIFTENVGLPNIHKVCQDSLTGYTILPGESYFGGKEEKCVVIMVYNHTLDEITNCAKSLKEFSKQQQVDIYNLNRKQWHMV